MPAPMTAPTPSAVSWKGPRVRFRLRSPVSPASANSMFIGFLAQIFAMRCSLLGSKLSYFNLVILSGVSSLAGEPTYEVEGPL